MKARDKLGRASIGVEATRSDARTPRNMFSDPEQDAPPKRQPNRLLIIAAGVLPIFSCVMFAATMFAFPGSDAAFLASIAVFGLSVIAGVVMLVFTAIGPSRRTHLRAFAINAAGNAANIAFVVYAAAQSIPNRGRQIRSAEGRVLPVRPPEEVPEEALLLAARAWRNNGDTEAASVSAFSMLSLDLAELGAPFELVRAAHEDALDEIRHAELCYELARSFGEERGAVTPMPGLRAVRSRECSLASVAVESWVEGAYLETVSAEIARALIAEATDDVVRGVLHTIAVDEARHAEHAWAIVEWSLHRDRAKVGAALDEAMRRIPAPDLGDGELGADGSLRTHGIAGRAMQSAIAERTLLAAKTRLAQTLRDASNPPQRPAA